MKVALVHDYLNQLGGGERVLEALMEMFPEAPIYTLLYDEEKTRRRFVNRKIQTNFLDIPFVRNNHRLFIPLFPFLIRAMNLKSKYDLIISDTAGFAKGINYNAKTTKHLSYIHTPLRYAFETDTYFNNSFSGSGIFQSRIFRFLFRPAFTAIRLFDQKIAQAPDVLIANSKYIAQKVETCYGRKAQVIYPPVNNQVFYYQENDPRADYFLAIGRFLHYKFFDLIIKSCIEAGVKLKVVGTGREEKYLKSLAKNHQNISFLPFQENDPQLRSLYSGAKAFIMANEEDFGLVMAEAQACGTPVIAYNRGGAVEIVEEGKTGILYSEQTIPSLVAAIKEFQNHTFDRRYISQKAARFSKENFAQQLQAVINQTL